MPIGQTIATWVLGATNLDWLKMEYYNMLDFFKDSPAYEWMTEDVRREEREEARQQILAAQQQALEEFRQTVVTLVTARFPKLARLAKKQVHATDDIKLLQHVILRCGVTQDMAEVEIMLLDLDKE